MNNDVRKLISMIQRITQLHDIRLIEEEVVRQAYKTGTKANFDYVGDLQNTVLMLKLALDEAQDRIGEDIMRNETETWRDNLISYTVLNFTPEHLTKKEFRESLNTLGNNDLIEVCKEHEALNEHLINE